MNTDNVDAKIVIGAYPFVSSEYNIESINIRTGVYDGNVVGVGCAYSASCTIVMDDIESVAIGTQLEVYFYINNSWVKQGRFWISEQPTSSGSLMTIEAQGALGTQGDTAYWYPNCFYTNKGTTIGAALAGITETSEMSTLQFDTSTDTTDFLAQELSIPVQEEYFAPASETSYANNHGITKKDFLCGIAAMFGGNVSERNGILYFVPKTPDASRTIYTFNQDTYDSDFELSRETYSVNSISIDYTPTRMLGWFNESQVVDKECQCYSGTDKSRKVMLASQGDTGANVKYDQVVECDWVGYIASRATNGCFMQGDLVYKKGRFSFIGYNENLYAGNLIHIIDENGNEIPFYIGEVNLEWDGGFTTEVSCNCNVDVKTNTITSTTSSSAIASSVSTSAMLDHNNISFANIEFSNVADSTISGSKFIDGTISGSKITDSTITGAKISNATITGSKIANNTITGNQISDNTITGNLITENTITGNLIEDNTIDGNKIADAAITESHIHGGSITTALIAESAIEESKIHASAITSSKIAYSAIQNSHITDGTITGAKIANATITGSNMVDGTITGTKISDSSITASKIADTTITNSKFVDGTIEGSKIKASTITNSLIADSTLTGAKIADASISYEKVDTSFITSLTADSAFITQLTADVADLGFLQADMANLDTADINKASIGTLFNEVGLIDQATIVDGHITGFLDAVNVNADSITAGTLTTDRLVIRGTNQSIVYALNSITGALQSQNVDTLNGEILTERTINADKIVAGSITASELDADCITSEKILASAITTDKIHASAITSSKIASEAITADKILAGSITADKLNVTDLSAINATIGGFNIAANEIENSYSTTNGSNTTVSEFSINSNHTIEPFIHMRTLLNNVECENMKIGNGQDVTCLNISSMMHTNKWVGCGLTSNRLYYSAKVDSSGSISTSFTPYNNEIFAFDFYAGYLSSETATTIDNAYLKVNVPTTISTSLKVPSITGLGAGNVSSLSAGADRMGIGGKNNLDISSWYGISFSSSCTSVNPNQVGVSIDCRYGDIYARRNIYEAGTKLSEKYMSGVAVNGSITWNTASGYTNVASYLRRFGNIVMLEINATFSTTGSPLTIGSIPTGFRPVNDLSENMVSNRGTTCYLKISNTGTLAIYNTLASGDGIRGCVTFLIA